VKRAWLIVFVEPPPLVTMPVNPYYLGRPQLLTPSDPLP
jgi:hypothetical protein